MKTTKSKPGQLSPVEIKQMLKQLPGWRRKGKTIQRDFAFKDYYHTMAFVNAVAWIANQNNHHPDLIVGYNKCAVTYTTHDAGGISLKDFLCAAQINALGSDPSQGQ